MASAPRPDGSDHDSSEDLAALLAGRRTVHVFEPHEVPRRVILRGIELARWAPNHRLTEPWRFLLLGPESAAAVVELNARLVAERKGPEAASAKRARWGAMPHWLVVTSDRHEDELVDRENYAATCCAVQNLALYLWSKGVGLKWTTGPVTRDPAFTEMLGIDAAEVRVVGLFWYGVPAGIPEQRRRPLEEVVAERP